MKRFGCARGVGSTALGVALLAAVLLLGVGTSQADRGRGHGYGRGGHAYYGGGDRAYRGDRSFGGYGRSYSGGRKYVGGGGYGGGGRIYGGGTRCYGGGLRYYGGGTRYDYGGSRYCGPVGYRYVYPRSFVSFGIRLGAPYYYYPPSYVYETEPYPVEAEPAPTEVRDERPAEPESDGSFDVTNEPPAGCYYYDPFCDRKFSNLDDYTDHVLHQDHARTIDIIDRDSGDRVKTLEFVDGYWDVQKK